MELLRPLSPNSRLNDWLLRDWRLTHLQYRRCDESSTSLHKEWLPTSVEQWLDVSDSTDHYPMMWREALSGGESEGHGSMPITSWWNIRLLKYLKPQGDTSIFLAPKIISLTSLRGSVESLANSIKASNLCHADSRISLFQIQPIRMIFSPTKQRRRVCSAPLSIRLPGSPGSSDQVVHSYGKFPKLQEFDRYLDIIEEVKRLMRWIYVENNFY